MSEYQTFEKTTRLAVNWERGRGMLVREDGTYEVVTLASAGTILLRPRTRVDGGIDLIELDQHTVVWVDEDRSVSGEINPVASRLIAQHGFELCAYRGPVLFAGGIDNHGDNVGMRPEDLDVLVELADVATAGGNLYDCADDHRRFLEVYSRRANPQHGA